uniref:ShKT domain-containing protein n=1 Tax=Panagrolaimus sp. PS1159 TaxID=55785 RepID=A0AC35GJP4_9BILA
IRLWRKNRSPEKCANSVWGGLRCCQGVDLNRNFNFYWAQTGASTNPCSAIFSGEKAFSEPETKAVHDFLMSEEYRFKLDGFITIHSYGQLFIHPYSHEVEYYPNDIRKLENVAKKAVEKLRNVYGTQYRIGTGADLLSPASGGSDDWAKESLDTKYVYLIELRPELEFSRGFILNQDELIPTAIETFEGIKAVIEAVLEDNGIIPKPIIPRRNKSPPPRIHSVPSAPMQNGNAFNGDKFVNGRFGAQQNAELSPFRAPVEIIQKQSDGFVSKATLTLVETSSTESPTTATPSTTMTTRRTSTTTSKPTTITTTPSTTPSTTITSTPATTSTSTTRAITKTLRSTTTASTTTTRRSTTTASTTRFTTTKLTATTIPTTTIIPSTTVSTTTMTSEIKSSTEPSTIFKVLEALTARPTPDTMARRLTQELLRKQLLRLQALKTIKETIRERMMSSSTSSSPLPAATIYHAPRFLTAASLNSTTSSPSISTKTTPTMQLPPLIVTTGNSKQKTTTSTISKSNPLQFQPSTTICIDKKYSCTFWIKADRHVCENQQRFMRLNCARSCKFCDT